MSCSAREFITRALLATKADVGEIAEVLVNEGVGTADGFNVNFAFLDVPRESREFHTIEVTPKMHEPRSEIFISDFKRGSNSIHTNKYVARRVMINRRPRRDGSGDDCAVQQLKKKNKKYNPRVK